MNVVANKQPTGILKIIGVKKATSQSPPFNLSFTRNLLFLEKTRLFLPFLTYFFQKSKSLLPPKIQTKQPLTPPITHQKIPSRGDKKAKAMPVPTENLEEDHGEMGIRRAQADVDERYLPIQAFRSAFIKNSIRLSFFMRIFAIAC